MLKNISIKKRKEAKQKLHIALPSSVFNKLDYISKLLGESKNETLRQIIEKVELEEKYDGLGLS